MATIHMKSFPVSLRAAAELERRRREAISGVVAGPYEVFQNQYWNDPVGFVHDCFRWPAGGAPFPYQDEILAGLEEFGRVSARGPHGLGKSAVVSWAVLWFALTRDGRTDWKIPMTASAWRQLQKFLLPEIHKWTRALDWTKIGRAQFDNRLELQTLSLKLRTGEAFALASDNAELIEGAHAEELLYIFDEAKSIPDATWDSAEGAFSVGNARWLAVSTPGEPSGRFHEIQTRKPGYSDWHVRHVTLEDCIAAGSIRKEWADARRAQWGETAPVYLNRVRGEFAESSADGVIPLAWVEAAQERWFQWETAGFPGSLSAVGVDVGGGGEDADKSTLAPVVDGTKVRELRVAETGDIHAATMALVGIIAGMLDPYARVMRLNATRLLVVVDAVGIGLGVLHRLREKNYTAYSFSAGKGTEFRDKSGELGFADWRSAGWWLLREMLEPGSGFNICLPPDEDAGGARTDLTGDLTAPRWFVTSDGKIRVESKDRIRQRIRRSTDFADAVIHGVVGPLLVEEEITAGRETYRIVEE